MLPAEMSIEGKKQARVDEVLRPGQIVDGRYRVDHLIAEGGMAAVWAGHNIRVGKRVALKVIRRSFATHDLAAEMLRRESIAASKVNHPNVVNVFDVIEHDGMTCIVMELLQGESLAEYLVKRGSLTFDEAATLLLPAMRGVAAAHAQGVVHRDLKPGNIYLCRDKDGSLLATKVLDFGISKATGREPDAGSDLTDLAHFGTPAYMAPEDIAGSATVDVRTDVYGFGVLLFESLTGRKPFPDEPSLALLYKILTEPAPSVGDLRPELPVEVRAIVDCALAKDPEERFSSVEDLIRAIDSHLASAPTVRVRLLGLTNAVKASPATLRLWHGRPDETSAPPTAKDLLKGTFAWMRSLWTLPRPLRLRRVLDWRVAAAAGVLVGSLVWARHSLRDASARQADVVTVKSAPLPTAVVAQPLPLRVKTPVTAEITVDSASPTPALAPTQEMDRVAQGRPAAQAQGVRLRPRTAQHAARRPYDNPFADDELGAADPRGRATGNTTNDDPFVDYGRVPSSSGPRSSASR
jgi:serine/threonine-protein kinase